MLIEEEELEQKIDLFPKEEKVQKNYDFYFNNCFMNAGFVADNE